MATWVGLDVTPRVRLSRREAEDMAADPHPFTAFAGRYSAAWIDNLIATDDAATRGVMVAGHRTGTARPADARIAVDVDPGGFAGHFTGCPRRL